MTRFRFMVAMFSIVIVCLVAVVAHDTVNLSRLTGRLRTDEHTSCVIQRRGLPAGHALATVIADVPPLLHRLPLGAATRLQSDVARYLALENAQPPSRAC